MKTFQQWWEESTAHPMTDPNSSLPACYVTSYQAWKAACEPRDARIRELEEFTGKVIELYPNHKISEQAKKLIKSC